MKKFLATTALSTCLLAAPALAQTGQSVPNAPSTSPEATPAASGNVTDAASPSATPTDQLQDIVVTAQRRTENLQRAAVAVSAVTGATITNAGVTTSQALQTLVPALTVGSAGGANATFFVRGVGNFSVNGYTDPAVAFNYDGVYVGRPTSTTGVFYDLERVEVLKGPQGTLYGRNATAGAINVLPAKPVLGEWSGFVTGSYGNYNAVNVQGAINAPLGENGAVRISGAVSDHDGYLSDGTGDEQVRAIRGQILADLTPNLTVRGSIDYAHNGGQGPGGNYAGAYAYNYATGSYTFTPSGLSYATGLLDPQAQAYREAHFAGLPGRLLGPLDSGVYLDNSYFGSNAQIDWKTGAGTLTIIPAFRSARLNNVFDSPGFIGFIQENQSQYSVEARFTGKRVSIFDYIVGGYFFDERVKGNYTFSQDAFAAYQDFVSGTKSYAAFGRVTANITNRLRLVGGLRFTQDDKNYSGVANVITVVCTVRVAGVPSCPAAPVLPVTDSPSQLPFRVVNNGAFPIGATGALAVSAVTTVNTPLDNNRLTYRGAVEYDLAQHSLLYASYETGYRSGGFSLAVGHETFQPEYITAYTIGSKNRFFDNKLQLNVEAFLWNYRNQQVNHTGVDLAGNQGQFVDNVGRSINKGIEAESQFLLTPTTLLSADVQYLDARFRQFIYSQPVGATPPYTGCAVSVNPTNAALYNVNCAGKQAYQSPRWTINLGGQQTFPMGEHKIVLEADTQYRTSRYVGFDYTPYELIPSTWTTNAQLTFSPVNDRWSIAGFVRNIEDKRYGIYANQFSFGQLGALVTSPPRTYGVRGSVKF